MRKVKRTLLVSTVSFLLLASMALDVSAQRADPNSPRPTPTPTPVPAAKPLRTLNPNQIGGMLPQKMNQFPGIYGHIRWKKDLGLPSTDSGRTPDPINCGAIRVRAILVTRDSAQESDVGHYGIQDAPKEENGYYVCSYSFTDRGNPNDQLNLPRNRQILVSARFGSFADEALNETLALQPWFGPGNPQPPSGSRRVVDGSRQVEITDDQPHVNVDFEIVYRAARIRP